MSYPNHQHGYDNARQPGNPPKPVSGITAITAGVLAFLAAFGGIGEIFLTMHALTSAQQVADNFNTASTELGADNSNYHAGPPEFVNSAPYQLAEIAEGLTALLFVLGGTLLMNHRNGGRVLLVCLASLGLAISLLGLLVEFGSGRLVPGLAAVVGLMITGPMLYLTLTGATKRWCEARRTPRYAQPGRSPDLPNPQY